MPVPAGARRSLDEADASLTIAALDEGGMPVGKKHNDGADVFQPHELDRRMRTALAQGRTAVAHCRERGRAPVPDLRTRAGRVGGIEVSAMVVCDPHDRHDTRLRSRDIARSETLTSRTPNAAPAGSGAGCMAIHVV